MSQLSVVEDPIQRSSAAPFECNLIRAGVRAAWIDVAGELDIVTSPQLEHALRAAQLHARMIVLDTREVSFIDCSGVHVILAANAGADWGVPRVILVPSPVVERMLKLAGVHKQIWTFDLAPSDPIPAGLLSEAPAAQRSRRNGQMTRRASAPSLRGADRTGDAPASTMSGSEQPREIAAASTIATSETVPIEHETRERLVRTAVIALPLAAIASAARLAWGGSLHWQDLLVLAIVYSLTGAGVTVGYHRLFTHRSFKTRRTLRALFAILGAMAVEGSVIEWAATHRRHHDFSDQPGDPHSPHAEAAPGWRGALRGLVHAHVGWMFRGKDMANPRRYARDLIADRDLRIISRTFPLWVLVGLALPFGLGVGLTGTVVGGLTGLLWGGAVRIFLLHHATFSINSLCHFFGRTPFATGDESRNLAWLAPITFGEAWHNNHHAFPTSARHGLGRRQIDPGAWLIGLLERSHLAWDVVHISPESQRTKRILADSRERPAVSDQRGQSLDGGLR